MIIRDKLTSVFILILFFSFSATAFQVAPLYTPAITVIPYIHSGKVMVEDFSQGKYWFKTIDATTGSVSEVHDNMQSYLYPCDFGGLYIAWIVYTTPIGGIPGGLPGMQKISAPIPIPIPGSSVNYHVKMFNIGSAIEQNATQDTSYKEHVSVDNSKVVWTDYRFFSPGDTAIEVYYKDISSGNERRITNSKSYKSVPHIRGDKIVWQDYRNTALNRLNADIYMFDLTSGAEKAICTESHYQDQPCVYGNYVVWQDFRNAGSNPKNADIYMYDLSKNQETSICTVSGYQCNPRIYGTVIVWQDYRNAQTDTANADIYMYDLSKGVEQALTTAQGYQEFPNIYGDVVTWFNHTDQKVYAAHLPLSIMNISPAFRSSGLPGAGIRILSETRGNFLNFYILNGQMISRDIKNRGIAGGAILYRE